MINRKTALGEESVFPLGETAQSAMMRAGALQVHRSDASRHEIVSGPANVKVRQHYKEK